MSGNNSEETANVPVTVYRDQMVELRERILADVVMIGEIPSPTFSEERLGLFLCDRFTEEGLDQVTADEVKNVTAIIQGTQGKNKILVAAHIDRIWDSSLDHAVSVTSDSLVGPGIGDNALGVAALTSLPYILKHLGVELKSDIVLLGASRSLGRGNLEGLRFFTDNTKLSINAGIGIEGVQLGRLSYSSLGMNRCEIQVKSPEKDSSEWSLSGAIISLNQIVQKILAIETPEVPKTSIILGSIKSGSSFNVPSTRATLRFEVRSEEPGMVARIRERIEEIVDQVIAENRVDVSLEVIARRKPGSIEFSHPFVRSARQIIKDLGIRPKVAPSISELSVLLDNDIPSMTLGLTKGDNHHQPDECIKIEPIFSGLAQLVATLQSIDNLLDNEQ
jgi:acetylornithine deacetylase/succinyl-diaminopimelate desuccinylase-like protein